jgi:hypothetical protein
VPHGGRDLTPRGMAAGPAAMGFGARYIFLEIFDSCIYFLKINYPKKKIKQKILKIRAAQLVEA